MELDNETRFARLAWRCGYTVEQFRLEVAASRRAMNRFLSGVDETCWVKSRATPAPNFAAGSVFLWRDAPRDGGVRLVSFSRPAASTSK